LGLFGLDVRMGMRDTTKWPGKLDHRGRYPKEDPKTLEKKECRIF
jgi:hypothetical protein